MVFSFHAEAAFSRAKSRWQGQQKYRRPAELWGSLHGEITEASAAQLIGIAASDPDGELIVGFDTEGGSLSAAFSVYEALRSRPGRVSVHASGICNSAGVVAFLGGDVRTADIGASFVIHSVAQLGVRGWATAHVMRATAAELQELDDEMAAIIEWRTRLPGWQVHNALAHERTFDAVGAFWAGLTTLAPL
jgi:ATP-dependent protease ClpP protease subunit